MLYEWLGCMSSIKCKRNWDSSVRAECIWSGRDSSNRLNPCIARLFSSHLRTKHFIQFFFLISSFLVLFQSIFLIFFYNQLFTFNSLLVLLIVSSSLLLSHFTSSSRSFSHSHCVTVSIPKSVTWLIYVTNYKWM